MIFKRVRAFVEFFHILILANLPYNLCLVHNSMQMFPVLATNYYGHGYEVFKCMFYYKYMNVINLYFITNNLSGMKDRFLKYVEVP